MIQPIHSVLGLFLDYGYPQHGQLSALQALHRDVSFINYWTERDKSDVNEHLLKLVEINKPDWIWAQLQDSGTIKADTLAAAKKLHPGLVIAHWTGDARPDISSYLSSICRVADLTLTSCKGHIDKYIEHGAQRTEYLQIGLDWHEDVLGLHGGPHRMANPTWRTYRCAVAQPCDVAFCGNYYGERFPGTSQRVAVIKALAQAGIDTKIWGNTWPEGFSVVGQCAVKEQHAVYQASKVALSINNYNDIEQYYSDRQLIAMASGTPVVCHYVPGLEREFVNGQHCIWFHTPEEAVKAVTQLLDNESMRRRIGAQGRAEVIRRHSWYTRMLEVYTMVETIRGER